MTLVHIEHRGESLGQARQANRPLCGGPCQVGRIRGGEGGRGI